jgi:hypothetical protein
LHIFGCPTCANKRKEKPISLVVGKGVVNATKMNTQKKINKKELVRGFSPRVEPWKELIRHRMEHV